MRYSTFPLIVLGLFLVSCAGTGRTVKGGLVAFPVAGGSSGGAKKVALVVGIGEFEDPSWKGLKWAAKDADDFAAALDGFASIKVLKTRAETSRAGILAALQDIRAEATNPNDTVVVYFSSHGTLDRQPGGPVSRYVVTGDTRKRLVSKTAVPVAEILKALSDLPSRRKAVILAFCHSGRGKSALTDDLEDALSKTKSGFFVRPIEDVSEATAILSASAWGETASEDDGLKNDIYTHWLVAALAGAGDLNGDGAITVTEAHEYARDKTYQFTAGRQKPSLELHLDGVDPIVLKGTRTRAGKPIAFSYAPSSGGLAVYLDGTKKGDLPGSVVIDSGTHRLALVDETDGRNVYSGKVDFVDGEAVDVSRLIPPALGFEGGVGAGVFGFFGSYFSSSVVPTAPTVSGEFTVRNLGVQGLEMKLLADYLHASGRIRVASQSVSFTTDAVGVRVGPGSSLRLGDFRLSAHAAVGFLYIRRESSYSPVSFRRTEASWGLTLSAPLAVSWNFWGPMSVSVTGGPGVLFIAVAGSRHTEAYGSGAILITVGR